MAQLNERSKPQYYKIVNGLGEVVSERVVYSKLFKTLQDLETKLGEKLKTELINE